MADQQAEQFEIRELSPLPEEFVPRRRRGRRKSSAELFALAGPEGIPPSRPTVSTPKSFPYGAVALLNFFKKAPGKPKYLGYATGFFVRPDLVLTAKHNLTLSGADMIGVYPAWDTVLNQSHGVSAIRWIPSATSRDIGMLLTQPGPGSTVSLNGALSPVAQLVGYASDYPNGTNRMSSATGPCHLQGNELICNVNAQQADSGAPIFSASQFVMAIHKELLPGPGGTMIGGAEHVDANLIALCTQLETQLRGHP